MYYSYNNTLMTYFSKMFNIVYTTKQWYTDNSVYIHYFRMPMCNSAKIENKTQNMVFKFFIRVHQPDLVFLVVCSIHKKNSWLNIVNRMVYIFSNNLYFLRKCQKSPPLQTSDIQLRNDLLKVSKNKFIKNSCHFLSEN